MANTETLRRIIADTERDIEAAQDFLKRQKTTLKMIEGTCLHSFTKFVFDPITEIPEAKWQGKGLVAPDDITVRFVKKCVICGMTQAVEAEMALN
ncbi:MAG: hypothetical protein Q7S53_05035 [bacterium]|nr:hypothetical protein [bacterium]